MMPGGMADDRRTRILDATCRVIVRDGAPGVRAAAIAREAGVSNALPLYYFGSVAGVIRAAFAHHEERAWARTDARLAGVGDPLAVLERLLLDELETGEDARANRVLWAEVERLAVFDDEVRAAVRARRARYDRRLGDCIRDAQRAGSVGPDVDAAVAAGALSALIDGLAQALLVGARTRAQARREADAAIAALIA